MTRETLTSAQLREALDYDGATGVFTWRAGTKRAGKVAGCTMKDGYRVITLDKVMFYVHRLAWLHTHGKWPSGQIDHINGDRADNRLLNLRECTAAENAQNRVVYQNNKSGYQGVSMVRNRYLAQIKAGPKHIQLGLCDDPAEAHRLYLDAKAQLHAFQPEPRAA